MSLLARIAMRHRKPIPRSTALLSVLLCLTVGPISAADKPAAAPGTEFAARELFKLGTLRHVVLSRDGKSLQLARGVVIEDDGPAAGYSYGKTTLKLSPDVRIRKQLWIDAPRATAATLLVARGGQLEFDVNGKPAAAELLGKQGGYWQAWKFDPAVFRAGLNTIEIRGSGQIFVALAGDFAAGSESRHQPAGRSSLSIDGGRTWQSDSLLPNGQTDGEYCVRLSLDQHSGDIIGRTAASEQATAAKREIPPRSGRVQLPVVDLADLTGRGYGRTPAANVRLVVEADEPAGTAVSVLFRTGPVPVPGDAGWTAWQPLPLDDRSTGQPDCGNHRWLQLAFTLKTTDPLVSPRLQQIALQGEHGTVPDWCRQIAGVEGSGTPPVLTGLPFVYESWQQPQLARLRTEQKLDDVAAGATTELELLSRLAEWSSGRWNGLGHIGKVYPAWNAFEILGPHADGTPVGGFCQQYNVVFLQACLSFGIPARVVSIGPGTQLDRIRGGHETVEVWSNDFRRWIYFDGNTAWFAVDANSGIPLSLLELRERQLAEFENRPAPAIRIVKAAPTRYEWKNLASWPPFMELRLVPRNDFFARTSPLPLRQGMRGWFWTGHAVWSDDRLPDRDSFPCRISRQADWNWPVNTVHAVLTPLEEPGRFQVTFVSHTPGFQRFEVGNSADDRSPQAVSGRRVAGLVRDNVHHLTPLVDSTPPAGNSRLETARDLVLGETTWVLQPGENTLHVRTVNLLERTGPELIVRVQWPPVARQ